MAYEKHLLIKSIVSLSAGASFYSIIDYPLEHTHFGSPFLYLFFSDWRTFAHSNFGNRRAEFPPTSRDGRNTTPPSV